MAWWPLGPRGAAVSHTFLSEGASVVTIPEQLPSFQTREVHNEVPAVGKRAPTAIPPPSSHPQALGRHWGRIFQEVDPRPTGLCTRDPKSRISGWGRGNKISLLSPYLDRLTHFPRLLLCSFGCNLSQLPTLQLPRMSCGFCSWEKEWISIQIQCVLGTRDSR